MAGRVKGSGSKPTENEDSSIVAGRVKGGSKPTEQGKRYESNPAFLH